MKINKLLSLLLITIISAFATSCLSDDDDGGNFISSGSDFATITGYSDTRVYFNVVTATGSNVQVYSEIDGKFNKNDYPEGSRCFITYNIQSGQDIDLLVKVTLVSLRPVTIVGVNEGTADQCKLDYPNFNVSQMYLTGGYINILASVYKGENRTWNCYIDTRNSTPEAVQLYLVTSAEKTESTGVTTALSINVGSLLTQYKEIHLHLNDQESHDHVAKFSQSTASN